jgi:hypothetical protein
MRELLLKLIGAKKRQEIRKGKLWEITRVLGMDLFETEIEPAKPDAFVKPEALAVDKMRVHVIKPPDNLTNLTKDADFL